MLTIGEQVIMVLGLEGSEVDDFQAIIECLNLFFLKMTKTSLPNKYCSIHKLTFSYPPPTT